MYNDKLPINKREVIPSIYDSMIPMDLCLKNLPVINFTTDDMTSKFEAFKKNKMDGIYLTEIMKTDWLHILDA